METVILKLSESDSVSSDVSDIENDHPQTIVSRPVKSGIVLSRSVKGGKVNLDKLGKTAPAVTASKIQPKRQTKFTQSVPMHKTQDKENKEHCSLVHVPEAFGVSDSEDDKPLPSEVLKISAVKGLCFSNSLVERHALAVSSKPRESTRIPMIRHCIRSSSHHLWITVQSYAETMYCTKVWCHGTCTCGGMYKTVH